MEIQELPMKHIDCIGKDNSFYTNIGCDGVHVNYRGVENK